MVQRKPDWLKIRVQAGAGNRRVEGLLRELSLHTVCAEANCPNRMECYHGRTAAFMILGKYCTRNCTFCNVSKGRPEPVDPDEPARLAEAAAGLGLRHVVVTSVTRDDLPDGGAGQFAAVVRELRVRLPESTVEVLVPDFRLDEAALRTVALAGPDVFNHNVETVPSLYPEVRPLAVYERSLAVLRRAGELNGDMLIKSGIMLGLGESREEVVAVMADLRRAGCNILTIGQYLAPSPRHHRVVEYVRPEVFRSLRETGMRMGFRYVASAPLVRSSYHAGRMLASRDAGAARTEETE